MEVTYSLALYNDSIRFLTAEGTSKNRIISPGKILHFYNAPPDSTTESLNEVTWWSSFSVTRLAVLPAHEVLVATQCVCPCSHCAPLHIQVFTKVGCQLPVGIKFFQGGGR